MLPDAEDDGCNVKQNPRGEGIPDGFQVIPYRFLVVESIHCAVDGLVEQQVVQVGFPAFGIDTAEPYGTEGEQDAPLPPAEVAPEIPEPVLGGKEYRDAEDGHQDAYRAFGEDSKKNVNGQQHRVVFPRPPGVHFEEGI